MSSRTITLDDVGPSPAGQWTLTVLDHGDPSQRGRRVVVPVGESLSLGRDRSEGFTALDDPSVSRRHVRLEAGDDALTVTDLGSSNGTFHVGGRVSAARLRSGEALRLGGVTVVARRSDAALPDVAGFGVPARSPSMARAVAQILDATARGRALLLRGPTHAGVDAVAGALSGGGPRRFCSCRRPRRRTGPRARRSCRGSPRASRWWAPCPSPTRAGKTTSSRRSRAPQARG